MNAPYVLEIVAGIILLFRAVEVVTRMGPRERFIVKPIWWALGLGGGGLVLAPFLSEYEHTWVEVVLLFGMALLFAVDRRKRWRHG